MTQILKQRKSAVNPLRKLKSVQEEEINVRDLVKKASDILPLVWPLKTFIAANPLKHLEDLPFEEAVAKADLFFSEKEEDAASIAINQQLIQWCQAFLDEGQAPIPMPKKELGFYRAWKNLNKMHIPLPDDAEKAILFSLKKLNIPKEEIEDFLRRELSKLPGWGGYIRRKEEQETTPTFPITLVDFLAIRLAIRVAHFPQMEIKPLPNPQVRDWSLIKSKESLYRDSLVSRLLANKQEETKTADAQLIFCIDVRSEPLRLALENQGPYETFGFAGFFGVPVRIYDYHKNTVTDSCPVLLKPQHEIKEVAIDSKHKTSRHLRGKSLFKTLKSLYLDLKTNIGTPFPLIESLGIFCAFSLLFKTLLPRQTKKSVKWLAEKISPSIKTDLSVSQGISLQDQIRYAENALRMIGLTENFSKLVVLCGHGSETENNPYASSLACGACGGACGGSNAKILRDMLNNKKVQAGLYLNGIAIPENTLFLAGEHCTVKNEVTLYKEEGFASHQQEIQNLKMALEKAKKATNLHLKKEKNTDLYSSNWSETRPEWGLARNAAFIIGPRSLTKNLDLESRCFLHSYNPEQDEEGSLLEVIMTAPLIVAQWINAQYFFSTLDNTLYGSGNKITQNVTGLFGIMQGNGSDLFHGLPLQSVNSTNTTAYHEPLRLLCTIYSKVAQVERLIKKHTLLETLFKNEWLSLVVIDSETQQAKLYQKEGGWKAL
jgi:uncharacterized protein YbcC (UPF0753/DUF2309 family)